MKFGLYYNLLLIYFLMNISSCLKPPCKCDVDDGQHLEVKFINQQEQNLVFGPAALYKIDSIQVLRQKNNFDVNNASVRKGVINSDNVRFDFYVPEEKSYIYYSQQASQDSLEIKWLTKKGKCCGESFEYYVVDSLKFNGSPVKPVNKVYSLVK